jgi:phosphate transport system protein
MSPEHKHIVKSFDQDLQRLQVLFMELNALVILQLEKASMAVIEHDKHMAKEIYEDDDKVDAIEFEITQFSLRLLAQRQPLGEDLRRIVSAFKIATNLERIGDYAENMAKRILKSENHRKLHESNPFRQSFLTLTKVVMNRLEEVMKAYVENDAETAQKLWKKDEEINEFYWQSFQEILNFMIAHPQDIPFYTDLLFILKNLERAGDRISNIAESIVFIKLGSLKVKKEK